MSSSAKQLQRRRRITRRLAVVGVVVMVLVAGVVTLKRIQEHRRTQRAIAAGERGVEAFEEGDYSAAAADLWQFLQRRPDHLERQYMLARSQLELPATPGRLDHARRALLRTLELDPDHLDAQRDLVRVYTRLRMNPEARDLGRELLQRDPADPVALNAAGVALVRMQRHDDALPLLNQLVEIDRTAYHARLLRLEARRQLDHKRDAVITETRQWARHRPRDPRALAVLAYAHLLWGEPAPARERLRDALAEPIPEPDAADEVDQPFAPMMLRLLDRAGLQAEAPGYLQRLDPAPSNPLFDEAVRRLFEAQRHGDVLALLDHEGFMTDKAGATTLGLAAMSALTLGDEARARPLLEALSRDDASPLARRWAEVIEAWRDRSPSSAAELRRVAADAAERYDEVTYFHMLHGRALLTLGEPRPALAAFRRAAELRPSWHAPRLRLAQTLLALDRPDEAEPHARAAWLRRPGDPEVALVFARARVGRVEHNPQDTPGEALDMVRRLEAALDRPTALAPLVVRLLIALDRPTDAADELDRALDRIAETHLGGDASAASAQDGLDDLPPETRETLTELLALAVEHDLPTEAPPWVRLAEAQPESPLLRAMGEVAAGRIEPALAELDRQLESAEGDAARRLRVTRARLLDASNAPRAAEAWASLAADFPQSASVQRAALRSPALRERIEARRAIVDRLRGITGDEAVAWRVELARVWLDAPAGRRNPEAFRRAVAVLDDAIQRAPEHVDALSLRAEAHRRLGELDDAIADLEAADEALAAGGGAAAEASITPAEVTLRLAGLQLQQGNPHAARRRLAELTGSVDPADALPGRPDPAEPLARRVAGLRLQMNEPRRAVELLAGFEPLDAEAAPATRLVLAEALFTLGETERGVAQCRAVVDRPNPAPRWIHAAAELLHRFGESERASSAVDRLAEAAAGDPTALMVRAFEARRSGDAEAALDLAAEATAAAAPEAADAARLWQQRLMLELRLGRADAALATAVAARGALGDPPWAGFLLDHAGLVRLAAERDDLRPLLLTALTDPARRGGAMRALAAIESASPEAGDPAEAIEPLLRLAREEGDLWPLQRLVLRALGEREDDRRLREHASWMLQRFPDRPDAAATLAEMHLQQGLYGPAIDAAERWRAIDPSASRAADLIIARALLADGRVGEAEDQLAPHLDAALAQPEANPELVTAWARVLIKSWRVPEAEALLRPLLEESRAWRLRWIELARRDAPPSAARRWLTEVGSRIEPGSAEEAEALARAWLSLAEGDGDASLRSRAESVLESAVAGGGERGALWRLLGRLQQRDGRHEAALASFREAVGRDENDAVAWLGSAESLLALGRDPGRALAAAERAVALDPGLADAHGARGGALMKLGRREAAIDAWWRAVELDDDAARWRRRLGEALDEE